MERKSREPIGKYISQLYRKGGTQISKEISTFGIGQGQLMFLTQLYRQDGISQEELTEILRIDKGTTARAIKKLEEENLVTRIKDEQDRRAYKVYLTDKAKSIESNIFEILREWDEKIVTNLTEEEKETFTRILKKICINHNLR